MGQLPAGAVLLVETVDDVARARAARSRTASPTSPRPPSRSTTPPRSSPRCAPASRRSSARTRKTSATPPPTARRRSRRWRRRSTPLLVIGAPNSSNSQRLVEVGRRAGCALCPAGPARRRHRLARARRRPRRRRHRRRLGPRGAGRGGDRRLPRPLRRHRALVETAQENVEFKVPRILREQVA